MDLTQYKEAHRVSDADNAFLEYYDKAYVNDTNTPADDSKHYNLGYAYSADPDWYYQWNRDENCYYVVVDKEDTK